MIYKKHGFVGSGIIDADTNLSVLGTFRLVEEAVTEMMGELKIDGITVKRLYNAMWVFVKNAIRFIKPLAWSKEYVVESFITDFSLVKLIAETAVKNAEGEIVAYAKTQLCALDSGTGKILKTSAVGVNENFVKEPSLADIRFASFEECELRQLESVTVRSTNIDFSHHTNNVEYVRFIMNTYSVRELSATPVKQIEVCYDSQSFEGDELQIYKAENGNRDILVIKKQDKAVIRCEVIR